MAVLSCTVIGRVAWNHGYAGGYTTWTRPLAAIMELAFEAVKSSSNYLTIFPNNGNLWKSFWATMSLLISLPVSENLSSFDACRLSQILFIIENPGNTWGKEQAFGRWFADGLYRGLVSSTTQASVFLRNKVLAVEPQEAAKPQGEWGGDSLLAAVPPKKLYFLSAKNTASYAGYSCTDSSLMQR